MKRSTDGESFKFKQSIRKWKKRKRKERINTLEGRRNRKISKQGAKSIHFFFEIENKDSFSGASEKETDNTLKII